MKKIILFLICPLLFLCGCHTPKKLISSTSEQSKITDKQKEISTNETYNFADTTQKSDVEISYFKIEFYPPIPDEQRPNGFPDNYALSLSQNNASGNPNVDKPPNKGAIKSIESYTIKSTDEQTGMSESKKNSTSNIEAEKKADINNKVDITEQPAPDPYRWRYIFGIVISIIMLVVGLYFAFRKSKFVVSVISFLKKLF
jgi:hypothetical protein